MLTLYNKCIVNIPNMKGFKIKLANDALIDIIVIYVLFILIQKQHKALNNKYPIQWVLNWNPGNERTIQFLVTSQTVFQVHSIRALHVGQLTPIPMHSYL